MLSRVVNIFLVMAAGVLTYLTATMAGFLSIDDVGMISWHISESYALKDLFLGDGSQYYRPLAVLSYSANFMLAGYNPASFHIVNIVIHLLNALLVYYLAISLLQDNPFKERFALIAALVFILHPLGTEPVVWISARPDLLSTFFFLLAMILLVQRREDASPRVLASLFLACMASLMSKEASVSLMAIAPIYLFIESGKGKRKHAVLLSAVIFAASAVYVYLRSGKHITETVDRGIASVVTGIATKPEGHPSLFDAVAAYGFYLKKLIFPFPLNFTIIDFDRTASLAVLAFALLATYVLLRRNRALLLPFLIVFAGIVPPVLAYIGKIPWTPLGERYLYLPMVGFSLLMSLIIVRMTRLPFIVPVVCALLLAVPTMKRVGLWCDPKAFWNDAIEKSPDFAKSYSALGAVYFDEGNYVEAERNMKKAISLGFGEPVIWQNLARIYSLRKDYDNYEKAMVKAASRSKNPTSLYQELILALQPVDNSNKRFWGYKKAIKYNLLAQEKDPSFAEAYYNVGKLYLVMGDAKTARDYLMQYADKAKNGFYRPFALKMIRKIEAGEYSSKL